MSVKKKKSSKKKVAKPYSKKINKKPADKAVETLKIETVEISTEETIEKTTETPEIPTEETAHKVIETPEYDTMEIQPEETLHRIPEKAPLFPFLFRRILEFLIPSLIVSLPIEAIRYIKAPDSFFWGARLSVFALSIFIMISIYLYRVFFFSMGNRKVYFRVNVVSYTIFALISFIIINLPNAEELYNFIFMPMNYISYLLCDIFNGIYAESYKIPSAVLTHIFMYLLIFISPLEMYGIEKKLQKRSK